MHPDAAMFEPIEVSDIFCPAHPVGPRCPPKGLFDISSCSSPGSVKAPLYGSLPYFARADAESLNLAFDGIREVNYADKHGIRLLVEPVRSVTHIF